MKKWVGLVIVILVVAGGVLWWYAPRSVEHPSNIRVSGSALDPHDATYIVEGTPVTLVDGSSSVPAAPGSASMITTSYFGNDATGDLNGDGLPDVAFILTQSGGGSGTFYYAVAALKTPDGYIGTNAILLGDRIAPQATQIQNGIAIFNYADRAPGEPMTSQPSVGVSKSLRIENGILTEVSSQ